MEPVPQTNTGGQLRECSKVIGRTLVKELGNTMAVPSVEGLPMELRSQGRGKMGRSERRLATVYQKHRSLRTRKGMYRG